MSNTAEGTRGYYDRFYKRGQEGSDTPHQSVVSLGRRTIDWMQDNESGTILDIGSGTQVLEKELRPMALSKDTLRERIGNYQFLTTDIAGIRRSQLKGKTSKMFGLDHVQSDATRLPFSDGTFDRIVSNLAIDFGGEEAFLEATRVLKDEGTFSFNLQDTSIYSGDNPPTNPYMMGLYNIRRELAEQNDQFVDAESLETFLSQFGLKAEVINRSEVKEGEKVVSAWWEVDGIKPSSKTDSVQLP